jgi:hypothetical protein
MRDTLNWEASGHAGNWSTYYYTALWYNQVSQSQLLTYVQNDVGINHVPAVVDINAQRLPNWHNNGGVTSHWIAIIGYSSTSTYTYIDTCGVGCNNNGSANGVYTVSQSTLYTAMQQNNGTGAVIA